MAGWVDRAIKAYDAEIKQERVRKQDELKALVVRVSILLGEVITPSWTETRDQTVIEVRDGAAALMFAFADDAKETLTLRLRCKRCDEIYLVPVKSRADLGRLFEDFRKDGFPQHADCPAAEAATVPGLY